MKLYCVRHGETEFNAQGRIQGQTDTALSELGHRQSAALARGLVGLGIEAIVSSPLRRALDTAQAVGDRLGLAVSTDPRLMEIHAGVFQGLDWAEIEQTHAEAARRWHSQDPDYRIPGGESRRDLMLRARAAFGALRESGHACLLVVAHGGVLAAAFKVLLDIPPQRNPFRFRNGALSLLEWKQEVKLLSLNQCDHLLGLASGDGDL